MAERRGIYERVKGSGIWWVRWTDLNGRKRREVAGTRGAAEKLLDKRHTQKLEGKKLPENLRTKAVTFRELCEDAQCMRDITVDAVYEAVRGFLEKRS